MHKKKGTVLRTHSSSIFEEPTCYSVTLFRVLHGFFSSNLSPAEEAADFVRKNASAHRPDICAFLRRGAAARDGPRVEHSSMIELGLYNDVCNERNDDHYGMEEGWV